MYKSLGLLVILILSALTTGCALTAPQYTTNYGAVATLKSENLEPVKVGQVIKDPATKRSVENLTIRGSSYGSPNGSFTKYFREALLDELDHANLLSDQSNTRIDGFLIKNNLDGSGFSVGFAELEARLVISRDDAVVYEGTKSVRHEWPSSFVGGVAIPRAAANYPMAVRKLLSAFYEDPQFIAVLKKH